MSHVSGEIFNYAYTGAEQTITLEAGCTYQFEAWGAAGGNYGTTVYGGKGGYAKGTLAVAANQSAYIYVGGKGTNATSSSVIQTGGFNGGGNAYLYYTWYDTDGATYSVSGSNYSACGGGASDIRLGGNALANRIIVAGGGGGAAGMSYSGDSTYGGLSGNSYTTGGVGGGGSGKTAVFNAGSINSSSYNGLGGTQSSGGTGGATGALGQGGNGANTADGGGGGGGYYGGGAGSSDGKTYLGGGGGGSGYVGASLTDTANTAGDISIPAPDGGMETGHSNDGYVRITVLIGPGISTPYVTDTVVSMSSLNIKSDYVLKTGETYTDCGFCWSNSNSTPTTSDNKIQFGAKSSNGSVNTTLSITLGQTYYIRAYKIDQSSVLEYSSNVLTYCPPIVSLGAQTVNGTIAANITNLVKGQTYYIRPYGIEQDDSILYGNTTTYIHNYLSLGGLSIFKTYTNAALTTYYATDVLVGKSYIYALYQNMNNVRVYNKNSDGSFGTFVGQYDWYSADTYINYICENSNSVPHAYAVYTDGTTDYLVGWSQSHNGLYHWTINQTNHQIGTRVYYAVADRTCTSYSRGGWDGGRYVYFMNRNDYGVYRWDIQNKSTAMVKVGSVPSGAQSLDSSFTGSGMVVNASRNEIYFGDGANESNGVLGGFNYLTATALTGSPFTASTTLAGFGIPALNGNAGTIILTALHPNIAYYTTTSGTTIRQLSVDLGLNTAPDAPALTTPTTSGYTFNKRPKVIITVPSDAEGNTVQIRGVFKDSGGTTLDTQTGSFVASGTGTVTLTPAVDLPVGTITLVIDAYDGTAWSVANTYTFTVSAAPTFPVQATDAGISKTAIDNLETWLKNCKAFRGLSGTDEIIEAITKDTTAIKKAHLDAFRTEITALLNTVGITPTWTDPTITAGTTLRKGTHWIEIFNYLKQI